MKKSVKFLAVLLIFLMPLSAFAESWWSPNRVRVNFRVGGSQAEGGLGAVGPAKNKCPDVYNGCAAAGLADGDTINTMTAEDKENSRVNGGLSIHYIMDMNILVGIHMWSTEYVTLVTQTSDWVSSTESAAHTLAGNNYTAALNATYGGAGTALAVKKSSVSINFLDVGYFYDMADIVGGMSVSGGLGLPLLGSSGGTDLVYGTTGHALNGGLWTESITADSGGSAMSYFADFGYAFGIHEALFSLRKITTEGSATVSKTKGLGKVLGKDKFTSKGDYTSFFLGYGYIF